MNGEAVRTNFYSRGLACCDHWQPALGLGPLLDDDILCSNWICPWTAKYSIQSTRSI